MSKFRVSKKAQSDIRNIARYTQDTWGAEQRRRYLNGLNTQFEQLAHMPMMAAERQDIDPPVRIHRHEKHLIVYAIADDEILIIRVPHHSEDWIGDPL